MRFICECAFIVADHKCRSTIFYYFRHHKIHSYRLQLFVFTFNASLIDSHSTRPKNIYSACSVYTTHFCAPRLSHPLSELFRLKFITFLIHASFSGTRFNQEISFVLCLCFRPVRRTVSNNAASGEQCKL